jgi:hypothetical protein
MSWTSPDSSQPPLSRRRTASPVRLRPNRGLASENCSPGRSTARRCILRARASLVSARARELSLRRRRSFVKYVATPLFFSLISEAYGSVRVELDRSRRLRDREIREVSERESKTAFVDHAHSAWLAQALYRVRLEGLSDEELLVAFFADDYPREAIVLLRRAQEFLEAELASRGET